MNINEILQNEDEIEVLLEKFDPLLNTEKSSWMSNPMRHSVYTILRETYPYLTQPETYVLTSLIIQLHQKRSFYLFGK